MRFSSAILLVFVACAKPAASPDGVVFGTPHPLVYFVAPKLGGVDLDGRAVDVDALVGRVAILRFWATWSPHARDSFVDLARLNEVYGPAQLAVVAVSVDADPQRAKEIADVVGVRFVVASDPTRDLARRWSVAHVPTTFVIDRDGVVRAVFASDDPSNDSRTIERDIDVLLGRSGATDGGDGKIREPSEGPHATR